MPVLILALANVSVGPVFAMQPKNQLALRQQFTLPTWQQVLITLPTWQQVLNGASMRSFEMFSKKTQDQLYGSQDPNAKVAKSIIDLINEVINEMGGEFPKEVDVKKMSKDKVSQTKDVPYTIAEEYRFIGIAPTNKTLYIDEDYFKENILDKTKLAQKLIIRTALKHYLNGTYSIVRSFRFLTSSLAATSAGYVSKYVFGKLSDLARKAACSYFGPSESDTSDLEWNPIEVFKNIGFFAAKTVIGTIIFQQLYKKTNVLNWPTQKYLKYKTNKFDNESVEKKSDPEKKELAKGMTRLISKSEERGAQDNVLQYRAKNLFDKATLDDAQEEVDKETAQQAKIIMTGIRNNFNQLKNQSDQSAVMGFMVTIGGKAAQYPPRIQTELQGHINKFIETDVTVFYNSLLPK